MGLFSPIVGAFERVGCLLSLHRFWQVVSWSDCSYRYKIVSVFDDDDMTTVSNSGSNEKTGREDMV